MPGLCTWPMNGIDLNVELLRAAGRIAVPQLAKARDGHGSVANHGATMALELVIDLDTPEKVENLVRLAAVAASMEQLGMLPTESREFIGRPT